MTPAPAWHMGVVVFPGAEGGRVAAAFGEGPREMGWAPCQAWASLLGPTAGLPPGDSAPACSATEPGHGRCPHGEASLRVGFQQGHARPARRAGPAPGRRTSWLLAPGSHILAPEGWTSWSLGVSSQCERAMSPLGSPPVQWAG